MNNKDQISDMVISSVRRLEAEELLAVEEALAGMNCMISAHQGADHGHHFTVAYDSSCLCSHDILEKMKEIGVEARIVGL